MKQTWDVPLPGYLSKRWLCHIVKVQLLNRLNLHVKNSRSAHDHQCNTSSGCYITFYDALTLITLTLNAPAVKLIVLPVEMVLIFGTTASGSVGVLLAVSAPVRICTIPVVATLLNGSWKTIEALALAVFEIYSARE